MKELTIEMPWPPRGLSPNARLTVYAKASLFRKTKAQATALTRRVMAMRSIDHVAIKGGDPAKKWRGGRVNLQLICAPPTKRYRDEDNLIANCKAYFDGIADALGINDTIFHFLEQEWGEACSPGRLMIRLTWEDPGDD